VPPRLPLVALTAYLARRSRRDAGDLAAHHEHLWQADDLPGGLSLEWLGTSGFRMRYQGYTLLVDPYVTRLPLGAVVRGLRALPDEDEVARRVPEADAILVGHAHFDHVLDVPLIAARTGARVLGSRSTANLMGLWGLADRMTEVEPYASYALGPFAVSFVPSAHSRLVLGVSVPFDGDLTCDQLDDLTPSAYGCGQVYGLHIQVAGTRFYHQGSAELVDDAVVHRGVDVFLCGISGRGFSERYLSRAIARLDPGIVVPHHHDDFFRPLDAPMAPSFNVDLCGCIDELRAISGDLVVRTLLPLQPVGGG
jgi:L-ascorbate metabolism protein UlaG (beta-lactamase superfamily)